MAPAAPGHPPARSSVCAADPAPRGEGDAGATLVITVFMFLALLVSAAIVIDLGAQRAGNETNQTRADLAALAAGLKMSLPEGVDPVGACNDAIANLRLNFKGLSGTVSAPCGNLPTSCVDATHAVTVTDGGTANPFTVAIEFPVPDSELQDPSTGGLRRFDGGQCTRMRVTISQNIPSLFAKSFGVTHLATSGTAVVHRELSKTLQTPNLWLLDPTGCPALSVQGGSKIHVGRSDLGGLITLDSDGSACSSNAVTLDAGGAGTEVFATPVAGDVHGTISLHAMAEGQLTCYGGNPNACDPADIGTLVKPQPERRGYRATRAPIDSRFNCKASYPPYHGIEIAPCPDNGTRQPFIDQIVSGIGTTGTPSGFNVWTAAGYSCNNPPAMSVAGNWRINCSTLKLTNGSDLVFTGGNLVFDGAVSMSGGSIQVNTSNSLGNLPYSYTYTMTGCLAQSSRESAFVYMRAGGIKMTGGSLSLNRATLIQKAGDIQMAGGAPPIWTSPTEGPLRGLALWSEMASTGFRINGGASMQLSGVFFTPEANAFQISGGSPVIPLRAQFVSYRLAVTGGASLDLTPDVVELVTLPPPAPRLIR